MFGPANTSIVPGTYVTPMGITSVSTVFTAVSLPVFVTTTVYSTVSPTRSAPPFTSTAVLSDVEKSGLNVGIDVTNPASQYWSPVLVAEIGADVRPTVSLLVMSTMSMSMPEKLPAVPASWGRSPTTVTGTPRFDRVRLKKLLSGFSAFVRAAPPLKKN